MSAMASATLEVRPLSPAAGAEIAGVVGMPEVEGHRRIFEFTAVKGTAPS